MPPSEKTPFAPRTPDYESRVQGSFAKQGAMKTMGITLARVAPGEVELHLPFDAKLAQHHGFVHAGVMTAAMDSACGYAAFSLMPAEAEVLTVEFKVNLLSPAKGNSFVVIGRVVKSGRTLTVAQGEAFACVDADANARKLVAQMSATLMAVASF